MIVETLLNFEFTSKILLGALNYAQKENPLTYCFKSMQIRVQTLIKEQPEYQMVQTYVKVTSGVKISNIFAVERKNETERFNARFSNQSKQLLWHGSKISNIMAILTQGIKISPPWSYAKGAMFGKGIYFQDSFEKSYAHTQDFSLTQNRYGGFGSAFGGGFGYGNNRQYNSQNQTYDDEEQNEIQRYRYLLLCEVATGKMKELREPTNVENFSETYYGFDSIKGCGTNVPDIKQQVLLEDGTILPQGKIVQVKPRNDKDIYHLGDNEYIIYDEEQVRIRYLVQIDTQSQEDKFL